jgi:hypothetical protein
LIYDHYHLILQLSSPLPSIAAYAIDITPLLLLAFHIAVIATLRFSSLMAYFIIFAMPPPLMLRLSLPPLIIDTCRHTLR